MAFMGMGINAVGGSIGGLQQPVNQTEQKQEDPIEKLKKMKEMLDAGLITQEDYDEQKKRLLGV